VTIELSEAARQAIAAAMQAIIADISECEYAAGWYGGIEWLLWDAVQVGSREYHGYSQVGDLVPVLRELSTLIDGWVDYDGYVPMADWQKRLAARSERAAAGRELMPTGDAGLERQADKYNEWGECLTCGSSALCEHDDVGTGFTALAYVDSLKVAERERDELRAQLAAQQAVVDAARQAMRGRMGGYVALREALRALDQAQAAQPEGEQ
jgi:hypothetical protein